MECLLLNSIRFEAHRLNNQLRFCSTRSMQKKTTHIQVRLVNCCRVWILTYYAFLPGLACSIAWNLQRSFWIRGALCSQVLQ